jgi:hypothetical protein
MQGRASASAPSRYGILIPLMRHMGWSWADLCAAPADLVEEIATRLAAETHWATERERMDEEERRAREQMNRGKRG